MEKRRNNANNVEHEKLFRMLMYCDELLSRNQFEMDCQSPNPCPRSNPGFPRAGSTRFVPTGGRRASGVAV